MNCFRIRKIEKEDLQQRVNWFNSPSVYSQMPIDIPVSLATTEQWFARIIQDSTRKDFALRLSDSKDAENCVAMAGLVDIDYQHGRAELYIMVSPGRTNQGFGGIALQWLCNYAFVRCDLHKLFLYTLAKNAAARRFYSRYGFKQEGVLRSHHVFEGRRVDRFIQGLIREDWLLQPWHCCEGVSFEWSSPIS